MPFDGSGNFSRLHRWSGDANTSATLFDNDGDDVAAALSTCITRNGQSPATADIPLGGHKITGLADAVADTDAANLRSTRGTLFSANPGYLKLTSGLIIQWGSASACGTISYPIVFPNAVFGVQATPVAAIGLCAVIVTSRSTIAFTASGFNGVNQATNAIAFDWLAIGF